MDELVEGVLAVGARLSEADLSRVEGKHRPVLGHALAVALHVHLFFFVGRAPRKKTNSGGSSSSGVSVSQRVKVGARRGLNYEEEGGRGGRKGRQRESASRRDAATRVLADGRRHVAVHNKSARVISSPPEGASLPQRQKQTNK